MDAKEKMELVYDGECPVCRTYCENVRLADGSGPLELIDARKPGPVMDLITEKGLDIDEGMVLKVGDKLFYGSDAVSELSRYTDRTSVTGIMNLIFFRSRFLARIFYPPAKAVRNAFLYLLGIEKIRNLEKVRMPLEYEIIPDNTPYALLIGALTGAFILQILSFSLLFGSYLYLALFEPAKAGDTLVVALIESLFNMLLVGIIGFFVFLVGLIVLGIPTWWLLHRYGFRKQRHAVFLGIILTFSACPLFLGGFNATLAFTTGLVILAIPTYLLLDRHDFKSQKYATFLVVALIFSACLFLHDSIYRIPINAMALSAIISLIGGIVGSVIWRRSYLPIPRQEDS